MRSHIRLMSGLLLACALASAVGWFFHPTEPRYEAAMAVFILLASFLGIFADRWAAQQEQAAQARERKHTAEQRRAERVEAYRLRRKQILSALMHEAFINLTAFKDPMFAAQTAVRCPSVYPRLQTTSLESTIHSGLIQRDSDAKLFRHLHECRSAFARANQVAGLIEQSSASTTRPATEQARIHNDLFGPSGPVTVAKEALVALTTCLKDEYAIESGIDGKTVLFPKQAATASPPPAARGAKAGAAN